MTRGVCAFRPVRARLPQFEKKVYLVGEEREAAAAEALPQGFLPTRMRNDQIFLHAPPLHGGYYGAAAATATYIQGVPRLCELRSDIFFPQIVSNPSPLYRRTK